MEVIEKKAANFLVARENGTDTNSSNWIGGSATLTPTQLTLGPNAANSLLVGKGSGRSIDLQSIAEIEHESGFGTDVLSIVAGENIYKVRCYGAKGFKAQIELAMARGKAQQDVPSVVQRTASETIASSSIPAATTAADLAPRLVACGQCGHPLSVAALACPVCRTSREQVTSAAASASNHNNETIRTKLKAYDAHASLTCLECGYTGLMGVKGKIVPWYASWPVGISAVVLSTLFFFRPNSITEMLFCLCIFLAIFWAFRSRASTPVLDCPSCASSITPTG